MNYYNEIDPYCAKWLENLITAGNIPQGFVHNADLIYSVRIDLAVFAQCHFFAGIAGWPLALKIAGWPSDLPVWTGSCPCQPFSQGSIQRRTTGDERHLWPDWLYLIRKHRPPTIFGEQVAGIDGTKWLGSVRSDLDQLGYAFAAAILPAACVGARHARHRFFFMAHTGSKNVAGPINTKRRLRSEPHPPSTIDGNCGLPTRLQDLPPPTSIGTFDGISRPVDIVRAFGNAIVPQVAALFIRAAMEVLGA